MAWWWRRLCGSTLLEGGDCDVSGGLLVAVGHGDGARDDDKKLLPDVPLSQAAEEGGGGGLEFLLP